MGSNEIFGGTITILEKNLDIRSYRHSLLVSNIANKDTPNYKAFDVAVQSAMTDSDNHEGKLSLKRTQANHISGGGNLEVENYVSRVSSSNPFEKRGDGNTVDIEREMTKLAENNLMYNAMAQIIRKKFQGLKSVIQGGGK